MKFLKLQNNNIPRKHLLSQTSGSDMLMRKIYTKKRGKKDSRFVVRKHGGWFVKFLLFISFVSIASFLIHRFDLVKHLRISGVDVLGAGEFVNESDIKVMAESYSSEKIIVGFNCKELESLLKENFLGAKNIAIEKIYPNIIKVLIEERKPLAILHNDKEGRRYLIDSEGYVLGEVVDRFSYLPRILYEGKVEVGDFLEENVVPVSVEILRFAEGEEVRVSSMSFYPKYIRIYVNGFIDAYIGNEKDKEESLKTIGALVKKSALEGQKITKIDLRYDKVIVLYE